MDFYRDAAIPRDLYDQADRLRTISLRSGGPSVAAVYEAVYEARAEVLESEARLTQRILDLAMVVRDLIPENAFKDREVEPGK